MPLTEERYIHSPQGKSQGEGGKDRREKPVTKIPPWQEGEGARHGNEEEGRGGHKPTGRGPLPSPNVNLGEEEGNAGQC